MLKISQVGDVIRFDSSRTIAGRGYYWSTAYLIDGVLIDTGCAYSANEFVDALNGKNLVGIINTHTHEDHIGANGILQEKRNGLEIFAHPLAIPVLENPREEQPMEFYRRMTWGIPKPSRAKPVQDGELIETEQYAFQVINTPGHSPDHICLYEQRQAWLFSGDLYVGGQDRALREGYDIWQIIASLKRVVDLPLSKLFPGCARVRDNPREVLMSKIQYLEEMGSKVLELNQRGLGEKQIARTLFGGAMLVEVMTSGHFSRIHLVRSFLGSENMLNILS
jgi:glyoxylase-like metal-dependent hydrolase (beta-lactamase superfamily II)